MPVIMIPGSGDLHYDRRIAHVGHREGAHRVVDQVSRAYQDVERLPPRRRAGRGSRKLIGRVQHLPAVAERSTRPPCSVDSTAHRRRTRDRGSARRCVPREARGERPAANALSALLEKNRLSVRWNSAIASSGPERLRNGRYVCRSIAPRRLIEQVRVPEVGHQRRIERGSVQRARDAASEDHGIGRGSFRRTTPSGSSRLHQDSGMLSLFASCR